MDSKGNFIARAGGDARRLPDPNTRKMTVEDKLNIASVSKTITAAAVLKLLNENKISVDTPIYKYLPSSWTLGNNIKSITFRELLTHRSGIRCETEVTYTNLKNCIANGINLFHKSTSSYNNSNFALFRMIIPRLAGYPELPPSIKYQGLKMVKENPTDENYSKFYASQYKDYVQKNIFLPIGLVGIDLKPPATNPALTYQFPSPEMEGESFGDMTETSASRGWVMSSKQLAHFIVNLLYTEKILPAQVINKMKNEELGLYKQQLNKNVFDYSHGGFYPGKTASGNIRNKGELGSVIMNFSNGVSVAMIVNSQLGPGLQTDKELRAAMKELLNDENK
jgi:CubicO group peptidase (beta-lactamase class C family)